MNVLCPRCNEPIDLGYLEKNGAQMASCPGCNTVISGSYKEDDDRAHWKIEVETPRPRNNAEGNGCGCGAAILMLIALLILIAMLRDDPEFPDKPPDDTPVEEVQN